MAKISIGYVKVSGVNLIYILIMNVPGLEKNTMKMIINQGKKILQIMKKILLLQTKQKVRKKSLNQVKNTK